MRTVVATLAALALDLRARVRSGESLAALASAARLDAERTA